MLDKPADPPLSIVIPARNEEAGLPGVLADIARQALPAGTEIVVVDDGSQDRTAEFAARQGARVVSISGRGYGGALKAGFLAARGEWLAFLDADQTYPASTLVKLWDARTEATGMLLANRFTAGNRMPWPRRVGNRFLSLVASVRAGRRVPDLCSGERLFPRRLLDDVLDLPDGLEFSPALTMRFLGRGHQVDWIPTAYHKRTGRSKLALAADGCRFLMATFRQR